MPFETATPATDDAFANGADASNGVVPASLAPLFVAAAVPAGNADTPEMHSAGSVGNANSPDELSGGSVGKTNSLEVPIGGTDSSMVPIPVPVPVPIVAGDAKSQNEPPTPNETPADGTGDSAPVANDPKLNDDFELPEDVRVATVIQRIVSRLRGGLASIRWNNSERPRINTKPDGESDHHIGGGRTAKDMAKRRRASLFPPEPAYTPPDPSAGKKPPQKSKSKGHYPTALHRQPRGFAPASHYVPRAFKMSWGRNTRKAPE